MRFKIQIIVDNEHGEAITEEIFVLDKSSDRYSLIGLSLSESKQVLKRLHMSSLASKRSTTHKAIGTVPAVASSGE